MNINEKLINKKTVVKYFTKQKMKNRNKLIFNILMLQINNTNLNLDKKCKQKFYKVVIIISSNNYHFFV